MMKTIRLSGTVAGTEDPSRKVRAEILYGLFAAGWDIYNSNGDQHITLNNIEKKIIESNAFMFMPGATLEDIFKAVSIFVGYQTRDPNLTGKTTVILNTDGSWNPLFALLDALNALGTIGQNYRDYLIEVQSVDDALACLEKINDGDIPEAGIKKVVKHNIRSFSHTPPIGLHSNVCVFCSASIEHQEYLDEGYELGQRLADNKLGCVSGAGKTGVMGKVVRGCLDNKGWAAGSNVPHIIEMEGLPDGLSEFWLRDDIYTRMEIMIEKSDAFIIFPGGSGTLQEMLALLIFKQLGSPLMINKPIVVYNKPLPEDPSVGFWDKLIPLLAPLLASNTLGTSTLESSTEEAAFTVANNLDDVMQATQGFINK